MNAPVRAVIFDLNGVLTRPPTRARLRRLETAAGIAGDVLRDGYWRHRPDYDRDTVDSAAYWNLVGSPAGRTYTDREVARLVAADAATWGRANQAVVRLLLSLTAAGVRTAILSNTPRDIWQPLERRHQWLAAADVRTLSFAAGSLKPESAIYHRCLDALKVPAAAALFIDDRLENVEAAAKLGLRAVRYRTPQHLERALEQEIIRSGSGVSAAAERASV